MKFSLILLFLAVGSVFAEDSLPVMLHDLLSGFFAGLRRDGDDLGKIRDPTQYLHRETLDEFVKALAALRDSGSKIDAFVNLFQKFSVFLGEVQGVLDAVGDVKDSQKLKDLLSMVKGGHIKEFIFPLLTNVRFHATLQELVSTFKEASAGRLDWKAVGMKLGEFVYIILSGVKPQPQSMAALQDSWLAQLHDIVKGFFDGLRRDGSVVDKIPDIGSIVHRETLEAFVSAVDSLVHSPTDVSKWTDLFTKSSTMLVEIQQLVQAGGDMRDSKKLQQFMDMIKTRQLRQFFFGLLVDQSFHNEVKEVVTVFRAATAGEVPWGNFGTKLGEFFHTILSHV
jgi:hypothetical protein